MKVCVTGPAARNGKGKAHKIIAMKSTNGLPTDFLADHEHAQRNQVQVAEIPDFLLQGNAGIELIDANTFTNRDLLGPLLGDAQRFGASRVLACCHKFSISSRLACSSVRPCCRS